MKAGLIVSLAFRNLTRNVKRTLITSAAVIAGVSVLIMGFGLVDGLDENVIRAQEDTSSAHVNFSSFSASIKINTTRSMLKANFRLNSEA